VPTLKDLNVESLPEAVVGDGPWTATVHTLDYPVNEDGDHFYPVEYTLISKKDAEGITRLHHISAAHGKPREFGIFKIKTADKNLVSKFLPIIGKSENMDVHSLYDQLTKSTARTLLNGHYLASSHKALFDAWHVAGNSENDIKLATEKYWKPLIEKAEGVTRLTVWLYLELISLGEASTPSVISALMGTGPRTVHTRLNEARKLGLLEKPGMGMRK
jgi:hypothetical protein